MTNRILLKMKLSCAVLSLLILTLAVTSTVRAQTDKLVAPKPALTDVEQAEQILKRAAEVLGGSSYLNVSTTIGRGRYTPYTEGQPGVPIPFIDYIVYPDKERTEFRADTGKIIQTNYGDKGWIYDGAAKAIKDMKPDQLADFKLAMRLNVDNLLRGVWRKAGAKIAYAGRREAGLAKRNLAVKVTYPDGFVVEFEFGAQDHLPAKVIYTKKNPENDEVIKEEDRIAQYIRTGGILAPLVIDHYRAGVQTSRINYETIEFNPPVADTLFERPANPKAVK